MRKHDNWRNECSLTWIGSCNLFSESSQRNHSLLEDFQLLLLLLSFSSTFPGLTSDSGYFVIHQTDDELGREDVRKSIEQAGFDSVHAEGVDDSFECDL